MTDDLGIGIIFLEVFQQEEYGGFLGLGAGVGRAGNETYSRTNHVIGIGLDYKF